MKNTEILQVFFSLKSSSSGFPNETPSYPFSPSGEYPAAVSVPQNIYKNRKIWTNWKGNKWWETLFNAVFWIPWTSIGDLMAKNAVYRWRVAAPVNVDILPANPTLTP
jgi:hypothetical protein